MTSVAAPVGAEHAIERLTVRVFRIPTASHESDGTLEWDSTTLVYVEIFAGGTTGVGFTYADGATARLIDETLRPAIAGKDALQTGRLWLDMSAAVRNLGRSGVASMAISAVDVALWDLKGKVHNLPVCLLLGAARDRVDLYGSGGFTSYSIGELSEQLAGWVRDGMRYVKMKIGREPASDPQRVAAAREAIGHDAQLFVDANGAYAQKQALSLAESFAEQNVTWYEEPVYHRDLAGLRDVRERAPACMEISAGEYGYVLDDFYRMLAERAVDVLQADATRCGGFSGLLAVDGLCQTANMRLSTHCAPHLHLHAAIACKQLRHAEYFFDHARIERMLFDGANGPVDGALVPDVTRPGIGLELKALDAQRFEI
ncbi:MAG TPA: enolase C-terminal domain-like protein [Candidatus Cybelea sp.]|nr:enolase C-terminal domain-like protein [Candidatus Cybelea sp.]